MALTEAQVSKIRSLAYQIYSTTLPQKLVHYRVEDIVVIPHYYWEKCFSVKLNESGEPVSVERYTGLTDAFIQIVYSFRVNASGLGLEELREKYWPSFKKMLYTYYKTIDYHPACHECGTISGDLILDLDGYFRCSRHHRIYNAFCSNCGRMVSEINSEYDMCPSCVEAYVKPCEACGKKLKTSQMYHYRTDGDPNYLYVCKPCFAADNFTCPDCGGKYHTVFSVLWNNELKLCRNCHSRRLRGEILSYSTNVLSYLRKDIYGPMPPDKILYGIELECENNKASSLQPTLNKLKELLGDFCIFKRDGSLSKGGIEIVSLPASVETHKKRWEVFFENKPAQLTSWDGARCGIHIHISKEPLGMLVIGKMIAFLNSPKNQELITTIAGRYGSGTFCRPKPELKHTHLSSTDKYEMLNLLHPNTVELRIFRGTLNRDHFYTDLEFAQSLVYFCKRSSLKKLDQSDFIEFINNHPGEYPFLTKWFKKKKISKDVDPTGEI